MGGLLRYKDDVGGVGSIVQHLVARAADLDSQPRDARRCVDTTGPGRIRCDCIKRSLRRGPGRYRFVFRDIPARLERVPIPKGRLASCVLAKLDQCKSRFRSRARSRGCTSDATERFGDGVRGREPPKRFGHHQLIDSDNLEQLGEQLNYAELHVSSSPGFYPTSSTRVGSWYSPNVPASFTVTGLTL